MSRVRVLVVDDEPNMLRTVEAILRGEGYEVLLAASGRTALETLEREPVQVVLTDARMPSPDGFALLEQIRRRYPRVAVVMMTAYATPKLAVQAIKAGAADYLPKPFDPEELLHVLGAVVRDRLLEDENRLLKGMVSCRFTVDDLLGDSAAMREIRELIRVTAPTDATVLLLGESGTGKEMAASALHRGSARAAGPFVGINCAAIPENLLESELFGHEKGAFTGAVKQRIGRFEEANGG
ncbi:MAG: sigma 54-interacting transcriptional regulator, partial [Verrucomicrobiae bacterium]|nr:sigma 54-interacting transcriptional regulator [Verrucomicrobiae bacterium]